MSTKINNKIDTETSQLLNYSFFVPKRIAEIVFLTSLTQTELCGEFTIPPPIEIPSLWCRILKSNILVSVMGKP